MAVVLVIEMTLRYGLGDRKDLPERGTDEACSEPPLHTYTSLSLFLSLWYPSPSVLRDSGQGPFVSGEIGVVSRGG